MSRNYKHAPVADEVLDDGQVHAWVSKEAVRKHNQRKLSCRNRGSGVQGDISDLMMSIAYASISII